MARPVTLTMIVKNEAAHLPACLASVAGLVHELVVVDTGSTDGTREVALRHGARVFDFPWRDDFAAARNESLRHAASPWIFWMDADDRLDETNRERLRALFATLDDANAGHVMTCVSPQNGRTAAPTVTEHLRLFRNLPEIRWQNRVHEQIRASVERSGGVIRHTGILIQHLGYLDPAALRGKADRNLRLLLMQDAEQPGNAFVLFNIGRCLRQLGRWPQALDYWHRALPRTPGDAQFLKKLYVAIIEGHVEVNQRPQALAFAVQGRARFPEDAQLLFHEGTLRIELGDLSAGELAMRRILDITAGDYANLEEPDLRSKARHNLAVLHRMAGRPAQAEEQLRAILTEQPAYLPAWFGLGCVCIDQGRWQEAEAAAQRLAASPAGSQQAAALRGRIEQARTGKK